MCGGYSTVIVKDIAVVTSESLSVLEPVVVNMYIVNNTLAALVEALTVTPEFTYRKVCFLELADRIFAFFYAALRAWIDGRNQKARPLRIFKRLAAVLHNGVSWRDSNNAWRRTPNSANYCQLYAKKTAC